MKWNTLLGCLLTAAVLLTACGAAASSDGAAHDAAGENAVDAIDLPPEMFFSVNHGSAPGEAPPEAPAYAFEDTSDREEYVHEDGTVLAYTSYTWQRLQVTDPDALPEDLRAQAEQNVETFNTRMEERFAAAKAESAAADYAREDYEQERPMGLPYSEEITAASALCGSVVTVRLDCYNYMGGAHPSSWVESLIFDLTTGQFVAPVQLADDPVAFHGGAAELLIEKADALGPNYTEGYWQDYRDTILLWDTAAAVSFDDGGMTVTFSPYDLGPYAMGFVELRLERAEIEDLLGPGGLEKLGWTETPEE